VRKSKNARVWRNAVLESPSSSLSALESNMIIGDRLRDLREAKKMSQGDIEKRSGLLRCYISRVENGHTIPAIETLEKMARAMEVPLYQLFYDGDEKPPVPSGHKAEDDAGWGNSGKDARVLNKWRLNGRKPSKPHRDRTVCGLHDVDSSLCYRISGNGVRTSLFFLALARRDLTICAIRLQLVSCGPASISSPFKSAGAQHHKYDYALCSFVCR
jgi:transcriptional regulator with XRE-family HTH domain